MNCSAYGFSSSAAASVPQDPKCCPVSQAKPKLSPPAALLLGHKSDEAATTKRASPELKRHWVSAGVGKLVDEVLGPELGQIVTQGRLAVAGDRTAECIGHIGMDLGSGER